MIIKTIDQLRELYGLPGERAKKKQLPELDVHASNFIQQSPFMVISTFDAIGKPDASPRGGNPGFVKILDKQKILIPDFKGNNRVDSLANIVESGRVGTLFFIPGMDETLRVNGKAHLSTDKAYLEIFSAEKKLPKSCIVVSVEEVFLHCAKALMRSKLWSPESKIERSSFPTLGQMLKDQLGTTDEPETQEEMIKRYTKEL